MSGTIGDWERARQLAEAYDRSVEEVYALEEAVQNATGIEREVLTTENESAVVLMEREQSGLRVELVWSPLLDVVGVQVTEGKNTPVAVAVCPAEALDAFHHPYCYLPV